MSQDALRLLPVALGWAAVLYKFPALQRSRAPDAARALWVSLLLFAAALTVLFPAVYLIIDQLTNIPNLARLLGHALVVLASWCALTVLIYLSIPHHHASSYVRRAFYLAVTVIVVLGVCFVLAHPAIEEPIAFTERYSDSVFIDAYRLAFVAYVGVMLVAVVRLSWHYRGVSRSRPALHLGLTVVAAGAVVGLGYVFHGIIYLIARRFMLPYPVPDVAASTILGAVSVSLVVLGATMPEWGSVLRLPHAYRWFDNRRACRRLYPLWRDLCRAAPDIVLGSVPSPVADAVNMRDVGLRLYRRVVEIRDGRLAIARTMPLGTAEHAERLGIAAGLRGHQLLATVEAACFRASIQAGHSGRHPNSLSGFPHTVESSDIADEVAFLQLVADAYQHSPIVKAVARTSQPSIDEA